MDVQIYHGADIAWKDLDACRVQAELWATDPPKLVLENRVADLARQWKIESMLDIGCGCGRYYQAIRPQKYIGIDQSIPFFTIANEKYGPDATFVRARAEEVILHEQFDLGIMIHVLQHVHDPAGFLLEMLQRFNCDRWCFTILTVPGDTRKIFNINEYEAALALPVKEAETVLANLNDLGYSIENFEFQNSVGVEEAREMLVWTKK